MRTEKKWMVYKDGLHGRKPTKKHDTIGDAFQEAERLSKVLPESKILIVEVIGSVHYSEELGFRMSQAE